jgi:transposase-like protein
MEDLMERPDITTLACVNAECQLFNQRGHDNLVVRKVYSRDRLRLLRCRRCGEEFSERRGTALFNTKLPESKAEEVIHHLDEGCSVRATARLTKVAKETVARLLRSAGRHAERFHEQQVHDLTPRALEFDEQWSFVKKTKTLCGA